LTKRNKTNNIKRRFLLELSLFFIIHYLIKGKNENLITRFLKK